MFLSLFSIESLSIVLDFEIYRMLCVFNFLFEADLIWGIDTNQEGRGLKTDPELIWSGAACAVEM